MYAPGIEHGRERSNVRGSTEHTNDRLHYAMIRRVGKPGSGRVAVKRPSLGSGGGSERSGFGFAKGFWPATAVESAAKRSNFYIPSSISTNFAWVRRPFPVGSRVAARAVRPVRCRIRDLFC